MTLTHILEYLVEYNSEVTFMVPRYDECILGIGYRFNDGPLPIYSIERVLAVLESNGFDEEEAHKICDLKVLGGWNGPGSPIYVRESEMRTD
jgi:hypothetical protein